jgi:hypothetical protein
LSWWLAIFVFAAPVCAGDECAELWSIAGDAGESAWLRVNGYQTGMTKAEALQIRRVGLRTSAAQDEWHYILPPALIVLIFEKGKLVAGTLTMDLGDYQEAYAQIAERLGMPDDVGSTMVSWRSEECDTIKFLAQAGGKVSLVIQSLDYNARLTAGGAAKPGKTKKKKKKK